MATDKKGFLLYTDYQAVVEKLSDEKAGQLFKIILAYVNDQDPVIDDLLLSVAFEPIRLQLKRDLVKYEATRSKHSISGKKGGIKSGESRRNKATRSKASKNEANEADNVNVNDNVNDNVIKIELASQSEEEPIPHPVKTPVLKKDSVAADGWRQFPGEAEIDLEIPELKAGAVKELIGLSKGFQITDEQLQCLWRVFKISHFNGEKFYQSRSDVFTHFFNWTKYQKVADLKEKMKTGPPGRSLEELRRKQHEQQQKIIEEQWQKG